MIGLLDEIPLTGPRNPYWISLNTLAIAFGIPKRTIKRKIDRQKKLLAGQTVRPKHRPSKITSNQMDMIKEFIRKREVDEKNPVTPSELCDYIETTFSVSYQRCWVNQMVERSSDFYIVDAIPLEKDRIDVSVEDLKKNHEALVEIMKKIDPRLIANIDETGWGKKISCRNKRVVSLSPNKTAYLQSLEDGHITIIPVSWANGDFSRSMMVVKTKTIERTLAPYGLPDGEHLLVVGSDSGYVTTELFVKLLDEIFIPSMNDRRMRFKAPNEQGLLIIDGATQHHSPAVTEKLKEANIVLHFLVPHSSHLTQPLDRLFFKLFKGELRKNRVNYSNLSKTSNRILHAVKTLSKTTGWVNGLQSWARAGFIVSLEGEKPTLKYDLSIILKNQYSIPEELEAKPLPSKRKREKLFYSQSKKKKGQEIEKSEETKSGKNRIDLKHSTQ